MSALPTMFGFRSRFLRDHVRRLSATLTDLGWQVRESIAGAVGNTVAIAARQAVSGFLCQPDEDADEDEDYHYERQGSSPWRRPGRLDYQREEDDTSWGRASDRWQRREEDDPYDRPAAIPASQGWRALVSATCRLVAWWLGRLAVPGARLVAFGTDLATGLAVWLSGRSGGPSSLLTLTDLLAAGFSVGGQARP